MSVPRDIFDAIERACTKRATVKPFFYLRVYMSDEHPMSLAVRFDEVRNVRVNVDGIFRPSSEEWTLGNELYREDVSEECPCVHVACETPEGLFMYHWQKAYGMHKATWRGEEVKDEELMALLKQFCKRVVRAATRYADARQHKIIKFAAENA